jgi:hypothetical protein
VWIEPRNTAAWVRYGLLAWYLVNVPSASIWILSYAVPVPLPLLILPTFLLLPGTFVVMSLVEALWAIPFSPWYWALGIPIPGILLNLPIYAALATLFGWGVAWGEPHAASPQEHLAAEQADAADETR